MPRSPPENTINLDIWILRPILTLLLAAGENRLGRGEPGHTQLVQKLPPPSTAMQVPPPHPWGFYPIPTDTNAYTSSPSRMPKRRLPMDDNEFHAAKRMMSEQLYNLQISENNAAAGAAAAAGNAFGGVVAPAVVGPEPAVVELDDDGSDMDTPGPEVDETAKEIMRSILMGDKRRHKDKVEERIEKLVRASMRSGPPPSAPVLYLCDAPWREIEEGKSSRMDTSPEEGDSEEGSNESGMLTPSTTFIADSQALPQQQPQQPVPGSPSAAFGWFSPLSSPINTPPTVGSPPVPEPFAWVASSPVPTEGLRRLNSTEMDTA